MTVPPQPGWNPGRTAANASVGTIVVIVTLIVVFCVLPLIGCGIMATIGALSGGAHS